MFFVSFFEQVVVNLGLVYKVQHHRGVVFQFVAFVRRRKRTVVEIMAAGGRYDHLVSFLSVTGIWAEVDRRVVTWWAVVPGSGSGEHPP